jgi:hypothetical protein
VYKLVVLNKYDFEWEKLQNVVDHLANVNNNQIWVDLFFSIEDIQNMSKSNNILMVDS